MGKKRVTNGFNDQQDNNKPPNHIPIENHHHRNPNHNHNHHHRHHNHQKPKKIKPEAKLLHTLNSHLKKLAKYHSRNLISLTIPPPPATENNKKTHDHLSSWSKHDPYDWFTDVEFDDGGDMGSFEFDQELVLKTSSFLGSENSNDRDLFGGEFVFAPDFIASHNMVMMFGECGLAYESYIPDTVVGLDRDGDEGKHVYDILELSSQEDMMNEFLKVNLFVS